jgi:uncharacterized phage infection (PIP) family protein YhgE
MNMNRHSKEAELLLTERETFWRDRCKDLERQIREVQQKIQEKMENCIPERTNPDVTTSASEKVKEQVAKARMLEAKIIGMAAEIEQLQKKQNHDVDVSVLGNAEVIWTRIEDDLTKTIEQYDEVISTLKEQISNQQNLLQKLTRNYNDLKELEVIITEKLNSLEMEAPNLCSDVTSQQQNYIDKLRRRIETLQKATSSLMKKFSRFLDSTHFSSLQISDEISTPAKKANCDTETLSMSSTQERHHISLKSLLQVRFRKEIYDTEKICL